ncbi:hypothetical protein KKC32_03865 [Patescibacteria group bacterium]|nr:hypothetical protein [Patescibacteria group bacterium]
MQNVIYNNFSEDDLKMSYWYVTHRVLIRKIILLSMAIVAGGLLLFGIAGILKYYVLDRGRNLALETEISQSKLDYTLLSELNRPSDLAILSTKVLNSGEGIYDIVSEVSNPNAQWMVESFDYYFIYGEEKTPLKTDFILPGQQKYVLYLGLETASRLGSDDLILENIKWKKVADYQSLAEKILLFDFQNERILPASTSGLSEQADVSRVSFDVLNESTYNFWEPRFVILMYRQNNLAGIAQTNLNGLAPGERKTETINLFQSLSGVNRIEISPDMNILDPSVFKGFGYEPGELK